MKFASLLIGMNFTGHSGAGENTKLLWTQINADRHRLPRKSRVEWVMLSFQMSTIFIKLLGARLTGRAHGES